MGQALDSLLALSGPAIGRPIVHLRASAPSPEHELYELLRQRNGFLAFGSALWVLPAGEGEVLTLEQWNADDCWRDRYGAMAVGHLFFAMDAFSDQFSVSSEGVHSFKPETGKFTLVAPTLEGWAARILADSRTLTGWPVLRAWQDKHGHLRRGHVLVPAIPFGMAGQGFDSYDVTNLQAMDAVTGMRYRADLYLQLKNIPPGTKVQLRVSKPSGS